MLDKIVSQTSTPLPLAPIPDTIMHFSTLFFSVLLPFSLALPRTKTVSSTDGFFVSNFRAFASTEAGRDSTVSFVAYAGDYEFGFLCKVPIKGSLYSDMMWYACDRLMSSAKTDEMSFQIVKDFPEMRIKRTWSSE
jgi:hypothetical protein